MRIEQVRRTIGLRQLVRNLNSTEDEINFKAV